MKIKSIVTAMALGLVLVSCQEEYEAENIPANNISGEWFVQTYFGGTSPGDVVLGYEKILTYNTAAADGKQVWIDDMGHIWPFKVKANVTGDNSFSVNAGENMEWPSFDTIMQTTTIKVGKIFPNGGKSTSGVTVDSIYMEAEFSDDPGSTYIMAGHYRTGFLEDEH